MSTLLKQLLRESGRTWDQLADAAHMARNTVRNYLGDGVRRRDRRLLEQLLDAMDVSPERRKEVWRLHPLTLDIPVAARPAVTRTATSRSACTLSSIEPRSTISTVVAVTCSRGWRDWVGAAGDPQQAATRFADIVADTERVLGATHLETFICRGNYAPGNGRPVTSKTPSVAIVSSIST